MVVSFVVSYDNKRMCIVYKSYYSGVYYYGRDTNIFNKDKYKILLRPVRKIELL